jgi:primosomal replication protein N
VGKLVTVTVVRRVPLESREGALSMQSVNKQAGKRRQVQCQLPQYAWRGERLKQWLSHPGEL